MQAGLGIENRSMESGHRIVTGRSLQSTPDSVADQSSGFQSTDRPGKFIRDNGHNGVIRAADRGATIGLTQDSPVFHSDPRCHGTR